MTKISLGLSVRSIKCQCSVIARGQRILSEVVLIYRFEPSSIVVSVRHEMGSQGCPLRNAINHQNEDEKTHEQAHSVQVLC